MFFLWFLWFLYNFPWKKAFSQKLIFNSRPHGHSIFVWYCKEKTSYERKASIWNYKIEENQQKIIFTTAFFRNILGLCLMMWRVQFCVQLVELFIVFYKYHDFERPKNNDESLKTKEIPLSSSSTDDDRLRSSTKLN